MRLAADVAASVQAPAVRDKTWIPELDINQTRDLYRTRCLVR